MHPNLETQCADSDSLLADRHALCLEDAVIIVDPLRLRLAVIDEGEGSGAPIEPGGQLIVSRLEQATHRRMLRADAWHDVGRQGIET